MRKTKIVATLGPASSDYEVMRKLAVEGVDVFRLNFAHGVLQDKEELISKTRKLEEELGKPIAVLADIPGRGPRIGNMPHVYLSVGEKVILEFGSKISDNPHIIPVPYEELLETVYHGDIILLADGRVQVKVDRKIGHEVEGTIISEGELRSNVSITIKGRPLPFPALSERDKKFVEFAVKKDVDYIALSFVQSRDDILELRNFLESLGADNIKIISKIETKSAIDNIDSITKESDTIMVARGDLGVQISLEDIPYLENLLIGKALSLGKPVILATQVLESMIESPIPTRAEIMDIATAVEKGVDAIMLSGETAIGKHPVEAIKWLVRIIERVEKYIKFPRTEPKEDEPLYVKFNRSIVSLAEYLNAKIVAYSTRGITAIAIARFRPKSEIYIVTNSKKTQRQLTLVWGVKAILSDGDVKTLEKLSEIVIRHGYAKKGDLLVLTLGWKRFPTNVQEIMIEEVI